MVHEKALKDFPRTEILILNLETWNNASRMFTNPENLKNNIRLQNHSRPSANLQKTHQNVRKVAVLVKRENAFKNVKLFFTYCTYVNYIVHNINIFTQYKFNF